MEKRLKSKNKNDVLTLNSFVLKLIALITMTIDHVGAVFGSSENINGVIPCQEYELLRIIGRIAFPIYCYLLVEGFCHTSNLKKYLSRVIIFAIISQVPYSLAIYGRLLSKSFLNVFFTLAIGLIVIASIDAAVKKIRAGEDADHRYLITPVLGLFVALWLADSLSVSYERYGIYMILIFYFTRLREEDYNDSKKIILNTAVQALLLFVITYNYGVDIQYYCVIALLFIMLHNHKRGPSLKYFFYIYYPFHLLVLFIIKCAMYGCNIII